MRTFIVVFCLGAFGATASWASPYLDAARDVARWLESNTVKVEGVEVWPGDALHPDPEAVGASLSGGTAGIVLFLLEAHAADPEGGHLAAARRGGDHLLANLPSELDGGRSASLYSGVAGVGVVLQYLGEATGDERYAKGAHKTVQWLLDKPGLEDARPGQWSTQFNDLAFGDAGTALYLEWASRRMGRPEALDEARAAADLLMERAQSEAGGVTWKFRRDKDFILPNFSHGGAGVGYLLATLYEATGRDAYQAAALDAAGYLHSVARTDAGGFLVPYGWPLENWEGLYELGWAHGAAGTARFFERLYRTTGTASARETVAAATHSMRVSGLPGAPAEGFSQDEFKQDLRFGAAGVAVHFLDLYAQHGRAEDLDFARTITDHLLSRGTRDESGLRWIDAGVSWLGEPDEDVARTGYHSGAAGYGYLLLRLDAALEGRAKAVALPDDPFTNQEP